MYKARRLFYLPALLLRTAGTVKIRSLKFDSRTKYQFLRLLNWCARAHTYIREFSEKNLKLKVPRYFSGAFKRSVLLRLLSKSLFALCDLFVAVLYFSNDRRDIRIVAVNGRCRIA